MRTNIDIDEKLIEEARRITGLSSKKAVVEAALEDMIRRARRREVAEYFGKLPSWEGSLDASRQARRFE